MDDILERLLIVFLLTVFGFMLIVIGKVTLVYVLGI